MSALIRKVEMLAILESLPFRSDLHPKHQLEALRTLRYRMTEHITPEAMIVLQSEIDKLEATQKSN